MTNSDSIQPLLYTQEMRKTQQKAFEDIILLIEYVRRCQSLEDYYNVQQILEEHIDRIDETAENAHQNKAEIENKFYHRLGHQYRTVGDALAWQLYAFQALPIYALGRNQFPGYRTRFKKSGLEKEREKIDTLWKDQQAFALHHDCTNCLRIGDLSIFYPDRLSLPEVYEVKVDGRETPSGQKKRMRMAEDLASRHFSAEHKDFDILHKLHTHQLLDKIEQTNLGLLWEALSQAKENHIGFSANSYIAVTALDLSRCKADQWREVYSQWNETTTKFLYPDSWPICCTDELFSNSIERMARPNVGVPYTIYPFGSDYAAALVTGMISVHYRLNTDAIACTLRDAGFEAECLLGKWRQSGEGLPRKSKPPYFRVRRGDVSMTLGDLPIHQMWFEGLRLEDFVTSLISYFDEQVWNVVTTTKHIIGKRTLQLFSTYTNMEHIWASSRSCVTPIVCKNEQTGEEFTL